MINKSIISNIRQVFDRKDIQLLSKESYQFIINNMDFIAHYNLFEFREEFAKAAGLLHFAQGLICGEGGMDFNYGRQRLTWPAVLSWPQERRDTMKAIIDLAQSYYQELSKDALAERKAEDLKLARNLAQQHGFKIEPK